MSAWTKTAGDVGDTIVARIDGVDSLATVSAVDARVRRRDRTSAAVTLTAAVTDATAREVTVQLGSWLASTATPGVYELHYRLTFAGGIGPVTWPEKDCDTITVEAAP